MDEVDADTHAPEEFSPLAGAAPPRALPLRASGGGEGPGADPYRLEVRAADAAGRERLREQMHLLAALEVAGCTAAPVVLEVEEEGHVRETAPAQRLRGGRRRDEGAEPPTAERLALAAAREALDRLLGELHERGWVLGAPDGEGIGLRPDGTVLVRDLDGLHRSDSLAERAADRRWVGTVLHDGERTLRRRVDARGALGAGLLPVPSATSQDSLPDAASSSPAPLSFAPLSSAPLREGPVVARAPAPPGPEVEDGDGAAVLRRPPHPASTRRRRGRRPQGLRGRLAGLRARLDAHRVLLRGGVVTVLMLTMLGLGMRWGTHEHAEDAPSVAEVAAPAAEDGVGEQAPGEQEAGAPVLGDPWELGAELAGARHAYVTGLSSAPVAAPGSAALEADDALRAAYAGIEVRGGGPVVHAAEIVEGPTVAGDAVLAMQISSESVQLVDEDGALTDLPATDPTTVLLHLRWDGGAWQVTEVEQAPRGGADGTGA